MIVSSVTILYHLMTYYKEPPSYQEDIYIAAKQISQYVLGTSYVTIDNDYTYKDRDGREMTLSLNDGRIVKTPGFEIILTDVDDLKFERDDEWIYINIERDEKMYRFLINYALDDDENNYEE